MYYALYQDLCYPVCTRIILFRLSMPREQTLRKRAGAEKSRARSSSRENPRCERIREEDTSFPRAHRAHSREWSPREMAI